MTWSRRQFRVLLAWLVLGTVMGMAAATLLLGHQVDRLELERRRLELELSNRAAQIEKLEESLEARRRQVVREVEVRVLDFSDARREVELEAAVHGLYRHAIGSDLSELDPSILRAVAHNRTVTLGETAYTLQVEFIWAVAGRLVVWVRTRPGPLPDRPQP
ncbi:hypothetical protein LIP_1432 [Limnochorda pilosa]|uniref:Uncharacterized protein n=1 Tax=Limnochorda pilosa TaxID=1555112 RepID=A0A0K2SJJ3_LIMPI|nr:hypothetical protein LIP_1432 [Limnochorda pilosa]